MTAELYAKSSDFLRLMIFHYRQRLGRVVVDRKGIEPFNADVYKTPDPDQECHGLYLLNAS